MLIYKELLQQFIRRFSNEEKIYQKLADVLNEIFLRAVKLYAPFTIVQTRAKNISSFTEKIIRKNKYVDPLKEITDLCGARIITHTQQQVDLLSQFIKDNFLVDEANSLDAIKKLQTKEFGYRSVHFIMTPIKDEILGVKIPKELKDKKAEVQVRTLLQHTWADIIHDRIYKTTIKVPTEWERESARLAALLENADENIARLTALTDSYTTNLGNSMNRESLYNEIDTLKTILENEPVKANKPALALKIARLAKFAGDWNLIIKHLNRFVNLLSEVEAEIRIELGYALCKKYKRNRNSAQFKRGFKFLNEEAGLKDLKENKETRGLRQSSENVRLRSMALQYFADICIEFESDELIKKIYKTVFEWSPKNPYSFVKLIEYDPSLLTNITAIRKNVVDAVDKCREDIRLGIESLNAYFTIGKLSLILKEDHQALNAYLKAIALCNSDTVCITQDTINSEIKSLARLNIRNTFTPASDWIYKILLLFKVIKFKDLKAISTLNSESLNSDIFKEPVLVVVGGADNLEIPVGEKFSSYLKVALKRFGGTIISGGTKSGIPGILGSAVADARRRGNKKIFLTGYIPENVSKKVEIDQTYKIIKTKGIKFSPLESIMMWADLISSGIKPADVRILGINGGKIAHFEYRLAVSLGAHLSIVKNSGGSADEILTDSEWKDHQNLHILPDEAESIWAFINHKVNSALTNKQLEDTAKIIHNSYLKDQSEKKSNELNLKPWNKLRKDLKDSNISQAVYMSEILNLGGFGIRKTSVKSKGIMKFRQDEIIKMAKFEHGRFVTERLMNGWKCGPQKDIEKKISPYLLSWDELPKEIQKYDINNVKNFPILLKKAGYEIYRVKE